MTAERLTIRQLLEERGGSYDLSASLRDWRDDPVALNAWLEKPFAVERRTFKQLSDGLGIDESTPSRWALPPDRRSGADNQSKHRDVPAKYIPRLAELMGTTVENLLDGVVVPEPVLPQLPEPSRDVPVAEAWKAAPAPVAPVRPRAPRLFHIHCLMCGRDASAPGRCPTCGGSLIVEALTASEESTAAARLAGQERGVVLWEGFAS